MIRLKKYLKDRELLRESLKAKSPKVPFSVNSGALYISIQNDNYKKHVVNRYNGEFISYTRFYDKNGQLHRVLMFC